eukprot:scaffold41098_cov54-Phaeocystis_antarctica.AAC.5
MLASAADIGGGAAGVGGSKRAAKPERSCSSKMARSVGGAAGAAAVAVQPAAAAAAAGAPCSWGAPGQTPPRPGVGARSCTTGIDASAERREQLAGGRPWQEDMPIPGPSLAHPADDVRWVGAGRKAAMAAAARAATDGDGAGSGSGARLPRAALMTSRSAASSRGTKCL